LTDISHSEPELLVASDAMREVVRLLEKAARLDAAILITGETGTGKELVARAAHRLSGRQGPWIDCNCAALPEHLIESELFGFEAGAFSGAMRAKAGLFELAAGGTLFLDEVGEVPLSTQAKLLRVLDGAPYLRLGGVRRITPSARIVAATNRGLEHEAETGHFRADLYYRLNQVRIHIPPLRERRADILALARVFLAQMNLGLRIDAQAARALEAYDWPGNARELRAALIAAYLRAEDETLRVEDLGERLASGRKIGGMTLARVERQMIVSALEQAKGNRSQAATRVGISRRTLNRRLVEYGLHKGDAENSIRM
jgi:DNA-binding NtrC family response regulator